MYILLSLKAKEEVDSEGAPPIVFAQTRSPLLYSNFTTKISVPPTEVKFSVPAPGSKSTVSEKVPTI